jgi:hypothetical protein
MRARDSRDTTTGLRQETVPLAVADPSGSVIAFRNHRITSSADPNRPDGGGTGSMIDVDEGPQP